MATVSVVSSGTTDSKVSAESKIVGGSSLGTVMLFSVADKICPIRLLISLDWLTTDRDAVGKDCLDVLGVAVLEEAVCRGLFGTGAL